MEKMIDCLFIGYNELSFMDYEKNIRKMGINSGAYRDLNLNFLTFNNQPYCAPDIFNLFCVPAPTPGKASVKPLRIGETFSAAIAYLGTYLHQRGFTFDYVNSFQDQKDELAQKLSQDNILTVAIITTLYVSVFPVIEIVELVRKYNQTAKIIIGGPFIATQIRTQDAAALDYLFNNYIKADFYIDSSQGEATLSKLLAALKNNRPVEAIENLYFKKGKDLVVTPIFPENNRLPENMVDWNLFTSGAGEFVNVRTAISCPFSCAFCGFPQHAGKYQAAPIEAVQEELNTLSKIQTLKFIHFIDDTFNVPVKRFKELMKMIIKNKYNFKWGCHLRCQTIDSETAGLMKESGCEGVLLGIESGSNQILANMNKKANLERYYTGIALLKEFGINTYGSFIIGFPGETHETVQETVTFIKDSGLDFYRAQLWYCERITPIWKQKEIYGINGSNFEWSHKTMNSKEACDIIEEIFLSITEPLWIPQYNFDIYGIFHLLHRDLNLERVKKFLCAFRQGIKEKLLSPSQKELSHEVIQQLREAVGNKVNRDNSVDPANKRCTLNTREAEFDF